MDVRLSSRPRIGVPLREAAEVGLTDNHPPVTRAIPPTSADEALRVLFNSVSSIPGEEWAWLRRALLGRSFDAGEALVRVGADDGGIFGVR